MRTRPRAGWRNHERRVRRARGDAACSPRKDSRVEAEAEAHCVSPGIAARARGVAATTTRRSAATRRAQSPRRAGNPPQSPDPCCATATRPTSAVAHQRSSRQVSRASAEDHRVASEVYVRLGVNVRRACRSACEHARIMLVGPPFKRADDGRALADPCSDVDVAPRVRQADLRGRTRARPPLREAARRVRRRARTTERGRT